MTSSGLVALALALLGAPAAAAQTSEETLAKVVKIGMTVSIVDSHGRKIDGRVEKVSTDALRVSAHGRSTEIAIQEIMRIDRPDRLKNGALIGLGVGLGLGVIGGAYDPQGQSRRGTFVLVSALGNGLICMGLGTMIDAAFDNRKTLYPRDGRKQARISPVLGRGVRSVAVSFTW